MLGVGCVEPVRQMHLANQLSAMLAWSVTVGTCPRCQWCQLDWPWASALSAQADINQPMTAAESVPNGPFVTCCRTLQMSVHWGRPEVIGRRQKPAFDQYYVACFSSS
jgi:hypothetical protein